jgi:hypothetical protein
MLWGSIDPVSAWLSLVEHPRMYALAPTCGKISLTGIRQRHILSKTTITLIQDLSVTRILPKGRSWVVSTFRSFYLQLPQ